MPISVSRVMADGASLVCSVESTRWPVRADSMAIRAVSASRISPTMMMSGSARSIERRPRAKVRPALRVHLHLVDALELVLDRVLDGDDVLVDRVHLGQRGVQGGGLARAGRPGDQHRAVGLVEAGLEAGAGLAVHAQRVQVQQRLALVQQAHDDALAVHGGHAHDAHVDRPLLHGQAHAAVLGHALLGDVQVAHDLHAGDHARDHPARDRRGLLEHAVHAEAHAHVAAVGLEVDVGDALLHRLADDRVDQLDHRRVLGGLADLGDRRQVLVVLAPPRERWPPPRPGGSCG